MSVEVNFNLRPISSFSSLSLFSSCVSSSSSCRLCIDTVSILFIYSINSLFFILAFSLFTRVWRLFQVHRKVRSFASGRQVIFSNFFSDTSRSLDYLGHFIFTFDQFRNSKKHSFLHIFAKSSQMGSLAWAVFTANFLLFF